MEHFIRIAFWIAALAACLQGTPVKRSIIEMSDWNMDLFKTVNCSDSKMYSPTAVKNECFITALKCIRAELEGRADEECTDGEGAITRGIDTMDNAISKMQKESNQMVNNSTECDCHKWPEEPFDTFVNDVKSLIEQINTNL